MLLIAWFAFITFIAILSLIFPQGRNVIVALPYGLSDS